MAFLTRPSTLLPRDIHHSAFGLQNVPRKLRNLTATLHHSISLIQKQQAKTASELATSSIGTDYHRKLRDIECNKVNFNVEKKANT